MKDYKKFQDELEVFKSQLIPHYKVSALNNSGITYVNILN